MKDNYFFQKILGLLIVSLLVASCSGDIDIAGGGDEGCLTSASISSIITSGRIPANLDDYDQAAQDIFSPYPAGTTVVARYVTSNGIGDGNTYATAASNVKTVLDGITNAATNKVYVVLIAPGTYDAGTQMSMKNHVAIIGGQCSVDPAGNTLTVLSGGGTHRVFNNGGLNHTATLYGVTIADGRAVSNSGGGMYNGNSSPMLTKVIFSNNQARNGSGMFNHDSSPVITKATFIQNRNCNFGGGMYNYYSAPVLVGVTFSENRCRFAGGGMFSHRLSSPVLIGATFWNITTGGGGIIVTGEDDTTTNAGGPLLINTILWGNLEGDRYILLYNDTTETISIRLYNSIIGGGIPSDYSSGTPVTGFSYGGSTFGIRGGIAAQNTTSTGRVAVFFSGVIEDSPRLFFLTEINGVLVHPIPQSGAVNRGLHVKRSAAPTGKECNNRCDTYTFYYSDNGTDWYSNPELTTTATPPADAVNLTATDATGYARTGRPDIGAYEAR